MIRRALRLAGWLAIAICCALPLLWFAPALPRVMQIAVALFALLALLRPVDALMIFAGLGPVAGGLLPLTGSPYGGGSLMEAMILAMLAAAAVRVAKGSERINLSGFEWALLAFAALVTASCLAQWPVVAIRMGLPDTVSISSLLLVRGSFDRTNELPPVVQSAQLLEGIGLAALTARLATADRALSLAGAAVTGAAGAAALNVQRFVIVALRQPPFLPSAFAALSGLRISTQYGDLNAAGSYFSMMAVICLALTRRGSGRRALALTALPVISAGLWFSGSRVALAAAILCGTAVIALDRTGTPSTATRRHAVILAAVLLLLGSLAAARFVNPAPGQAPFGYSVFARAELLKTGLRMLADRPLLGVGISQFYELFPRYSSAQLRQAFATSAVVPVTHENAHNNLMQIAAELGVAGLAAFVLLLVIALRANGGGANPRWRLAMLAGLTTFLLTCLGGHPLLTPMVAFAFWLGLGLAESGAPPTSTSAVTYLRRAVVAAAVLLVVTLPVRAAYERRDADLDSVSIGLSRWDHDQEGNRFRRAGHRSALFVASKSPFVKIPLRSPDDRQRLVQLRIDGRQVSEVLVPPGMWVETRLLLPPDRKAPKFRRIDLIVRTDAADALVPDRAILVGRSSEAAPQE